MARGDLIAVSVPGDFGKPRPALIVQSDLFGDLGSITVLPLTSERLDANDCRIAIDPTDENGLRNPSFVMVDKIGTLRRVKAGRVIGRIMQSEIEAVDRALAIFLGIG